MDKRTLIFVVLLTFILLGVNTYFEKDRQAELRKWNEQNQTKNAHKQQQLESEINDNVAQPSQLPIVELYADSEGEHFITFGIQVDQSILTLSQKLAIPPVVYSRKQATTESLNEFKLIYTTEKQGSPALYQSGQTQPLKIGYLPDFGKTQLQLLEPQSSNPQTFKINLGDFTDGHFSIPLEKLRALKKEEQPVVAQNAIVLMKSDDKYLPVAIYEADSKKLIYLSDISNLTTTAIKTKFKNDQASGKKAEEQFFVLESPYQQFVFSNYGGALAEINLPFSNASDHESVVKEIEFDRQMVAKHPYNARFPAHPYYTSKKSEDGSFEKHEQGKLGGYYPLLRRDLIERGKWKSVRVSPQYYALNLVSDYPEFSELVYEVKQFDENTIVFEATQSHRRITKTFTIKNNDKAAPYCLNIAIKIEGDSRNIWLTSGVPEVEWISGAPAPVLKYRMTRNQKTVVEAIDLPTDSLTVNSTALDWICNSNGFLGMILDPLDDKNPGYRTQYVSGVTVPSRLVELDQEYDLYKAQDMPGYMVMLPLKSSGGTTNFRIYAGPFAESVLKTVDSIYTDPQTGYNPDYIACQSFHGWFAFISEPFAKFLFILMKFFHSVTNSWALSIVLLTVALRVMMYPLNAWSSKSMLKMQQIGPEVTAIQEKHKKDPKKAQLEVMALYRDKGVNPVSGCFPMLIQMPFLIGMFDLLKSTFELRGASFIPGWIDDLSAPDVLFTWAMPIFFIGNQFHLLPFMLGAVMFMQQKMMSTLPKDPSQLTDQQRQQKAMGNIMSLVFTLMFYNFPSGLNIYWLSSMLLGMLQQWWTAKTMKMPVKNPK